MGNKLKTINFIKKANKIHNNYYNYRDTIYKGVNSKVLIICPIHGEFTQIARDHLKGCGCPKCGVIKSHKKTIIGKEEFISKAKEIHGNKYDYSKVNYINNRSKIIIICPIHGNFEQTPYRHLNSFGCSQCIKINKLHNKSLTNNEFIEKAKNIHGEKYDYSNVEYINSKSVINIICPIHGEFTQKASYHLNGCGCPKCGKISSINKRTTTKEEFISKAKEIHGDKYDYSKVEYKNALTEITIICTVHGEFKQTPNKHLLGQGCEKCSFLKRGDYQKSNTNDFITKAKEIHSEKYDYSKVNYINNRIKVTITCPIHGDFEQIPRDHLHNHGCPMCGKIVSNAENELFSYIKSIVGENNVEQHNRTILNGEELDIYIPSKKIVVEYNGLRWHSEQFGKDKNYHLNKTLKCEEQGIKLIQIFEDEWLYKVNIVKKYFSYILTDLEVEDKEANFIIKEINSNTAKNFIINNSLFYNKTIGEINIGYYTNNILSAAISLNSNTNNDENYEQIAFSVYNNNLNIYSIYKKLLSYFIKKYNVAKITTYLDYRWFSKINNFYQKIGFTFESIEEPRYYYFDKQKRIINNDNRCFKIYDCGFLRYTLNNPQKIL